MGLEDVVRALRSQVQLILVLVLVGLAAAAGLAALKTPVYEATAQINIVGPPGAADPSGQATALQKIPTYIKVLPGQDYLQRTVDQLRLDADWQDLQDRVTVTNPTATSLLDITVEDSSASRAAAVANALAGGWDDHLGRIQQSTIRSTLVSRADAPDSPASPKLFLWLAVAGVVGLALGVSYALVRGSLDRSVRDEDELAELTALPVRGVVPYDPAARKTPLPVQSPGTGARAEALRQLRTNLQFLQLDEDAAAPHSVLVTSAVAGEGKTSIACNVAVALSQAGLSVALVGADLRRGELSTYMGSQGTDGLTSVLAGWVTVDAALQRWGDGSDELWVLPSGPTPPHPSELLASEQMQLLVRELEQRVDIVVLDSAPLLPVADTAALAAICSGTLLVVAAGRTSREEITRAVSTLTGVDAVVYGTVLNLAPRRTRTADSAYLEAGAAPRR